MQARRQQTMGNRYGGTGQDAKVAPPAVSSPTIDFRYFRFNLLFIQLAPSAGFCGQLHLCKLHVFFYIGQGCEHTYFKVYLLQTCTTQLWEANVNMDAPLLPYLGTPFCLGTSSSSMDALRNWSRSDLKWTLACAVEQKKKVFKTLIGSFKYYLHDAVVAYGQGISSALRR